MIASQALSKVKNLPGYLAGQTYTIDCWTSMMRHMTRARRLAFILTLMFFARSLESFAQDQRAVSSSAAADLAQDQGVNQLKPPLAATITLDQAVGSALQNNPQIKNSELSISISKDKTSVVRTNLFPHVHVQMLGAQLLTPLNFDFKKGVFGNYPATGPIPDENINVSTDMKPILFLNSYIAQPLLQIPRIRLGMQQSKLQTSIATEQHKMQRQQIANQIRRAYYKGLELTKSLDVSQATLALYRNIDQLTSQYYEEKVVLKAELIQVKQQLASAELEDLRTRNAIATQKEEINRLIGRDIRTEFAQAMVAAESSLDQDLPSAQARALTARAELRQNGFQSEQLRLDRRIKKLEYLPDVSLIVDYFSVFGTQILPSNVVVAGLFLNWEAFDWGKKRFEIRQHHKSLLQLKNSRDELERQILQEVASSFRQLNQSRQQLRVSELGRELAMEQLRVATNRYNEHASLLRDVLKAQRDVTQANYQYNQDLLAHWTARADFEKAIGNE